MTNNKIVYYDVPHVKTVRELMDRALAEAADKIAFKYFAGTEVKEATYRRFYEDVQALGTALAELGVLDRHIAIAAPNSYEFVTVYLTVLQSCGVFVPMDKELPEADLLNVLNHSDAEVVFCSEKYEAIFRENRSALPNVRRFICFDRAEDDGDFLSFCKFIEAGRELYLAGDRRFAACDGDVNAMKLLVYTSGTTGMAKGVMLSEHNLISCVCYGLEVSTVYDTCLSVLPYNHTYEAVAGLLVALHHHSTICINDNLRHVLKNLQLFKPDYIYLVPAFAEMFYKKIWANAKSSGKELPLKALIASSNAMRHLGIDKRAALFKSIHAAFGGNLKKIVCGGAPLRAELGDFFDSIGISLINGYGITECSPLVSANQDYFNDCTTVGIPLRCIDVTIEEPGEDGNGEICVKGDTVMLGYYKEPGLTAEVLTPDGTFHTGDLGHINAKGQLVITGRKKNLIVLDNGKNIFPEEIENYITAIPYVQDVVVFGIKGSDGTESSLGAELYLSTDKLTEYKINDPEAALRKDLAKACKSLPAYKRISKFYIRPIPFEKTTTNKVKRSSAMFANRTPEPPASAEETAE